MLIAPSRMPPPGRRPCGTFSALRSAGVRLVLSVLVTALLGLVAATDGAARATWSGVGVITPGHESPLADMVADVRGNAAPSQEAFDDDMPPVLTVTAPGFDAVARPYVRVSASCSDDDPAGCRSLKVYEVVQGTTAPEGTLLASGRSQIDQVVAMSGEGGLRFVAEDSAGQTAGDGRTVRFDDSPGLIEVERVDTPDGTSILDVREDRLLISGAQGLAVVTRGTGVTTPIPKPPIDPQYPFIPKLYYEGGALTPNGAIFQVAAIGGQSGPPTIRVVYEWRDGALQELAHRYGYPSPEPPALKVNGDYAIWTQMGAAYEQVILVRRDLLNGVTTTVADDLTYETSDAGVAANGDVVYEARDHNIYRFRDGVTSSVTNEAGVRNTKPVTDGHTVVYQQQLPPDFQLASINAYGSSGLTTLAPARGGPLRPGSDYQANGGHVAFTRPDSSGTMQVWVDSRQVSTLGTSSAIDVLAPNGEVTFISGDLAYLARQWTAPIRILSNGHRFFVNGTWYVALGRSLFRIDLDVPSAILTGVSPPSVTGCNRSFTLTVDGAGFLPTATVLWNGEARPTTFINSSHVSATISGNDATTAGTASVAVAQVPGGGAGSSRLSVEVAGVPLSVTSVSPAFGPSTGGTPVSLTGCGFATGATVTFGGVAATDVTFVSRHVDHGYDPVSPCRCGGCRRGQSRRSERFTDQRFHLHRAVGGDLKAVLRRRGGQLVLRLCLRAGQSPSRDRRQRHPPFPAGGRRKLCLCARPAAPQPANGGREERARPDAGRAASRPSWSPTSTSWRIAR